MLQGRGVCNMIWFDDDGNQFYYNIKEGKVAGVFVIFWC